MYEYDAEITSVYDGDTCTAIIDLGFNLFTKNAKIRLSGIDTPEIRGESRESGIKSREYLRGKILVKKVRILSEKKGKYGRYLATIWLLDESGQPELHSINEELLQQGLAVPY